MSESLGLGEADADARWIGVRRHQAVLVVLGIGLLGDWIMSERHSVIELVVSLVVFSGCGSRG